MKFNDAQYLGMVICFNTFSTYFQFIYGTSLHIFAYLSIGAPILLKDHKKCEYTGIYRPIIKLYLPTITLSKLKIYQNIQSYLPTLVTVCRVYNACIYLSVINVYITFLLLLKEAETKNINT